MSHARDRSLANEAARLVLDRIGLPTYLFAVELDAHEWVVDLEHPRGGAWRRVVLRAAHDALLSTLDDPARREELARAWSAHISRADAA